MDIQAQCGVGDRVLVVWSDLGANPQSLQEVVERIKVRFGSIPQSLQEVVERSKARFGSKSSIP